MYRKDRLFQKYLNNQCSEDELSSLLKDFADSGFEHQLKDRIEAEFYKDQDINANLDQMVEEVYQRLTHHIHPVKELYPAKKNLLWACAAAALFIFMLAGIIKTLAPSGIKEKGYTQTAVIKTKKAQHNKAILTLSSGKSIDLDGASSGALAVQDGVEVIKSSSGALIYKIRQDGSGSNSTSATNTISTPNGGQYQVQLPDGTMVWLNAESSLTYPVSFIAHERQVQLTGEAYFEVAKNKHRPFNVYLQNKNKVTVLGTHFNIRAYSDAPTIRTTLFEGSVVVSAGLASTKIKPGQQAESFSNQHLSVNNNANLEQILAWKNGFFSVDVISLQELMKDVEKWYNVKVVYTEKMDVEFVAKIPKALELPELLKLLEYTKQIHFKKEGKIIYVMK